MPDQDLINRLLTIAGEIMEDVSVVAIVDDGKLTSAARTQAVIAAAADIGVLAGAASVILARVHSA